MDSPGAALSRIYYEQLVGPALVARWPDLPHAAGRLGSGSDVLGLDDAVSQDHDWGLRLTLLVPADMVEQVSAHVNTVLPDAFGGYPTRFVTTWDQQLRHRVEIEDVGSFVISRTGVDAVTSLSVADWLSLTGQAVLEVTAGPVFIDTSGELTAARDRLAWYPEDVWAYVVATDWARVGQELPFVGRTADRGDDLGSRVIASRLVDVAVHLAHLLERRWPPYSKWAGTSLSQLPRAGVVAEPLRGALGTNDWRLREEGLIEALRALNRLQRDVGLPVLDDPVEPFWERPYRGIRGGVVAKLHGSIADATVRGLPMGVGSAEQWSCNAHVLLDSSRRRAGPATGYQPAE